MSRENNSFIAYNTVSIEDSNDDDVTSLDEFEDAVEYMDDAYLIKTLTGKNTETNRTNHQHNTDTLSSAEDLEKFNEIGDITNIIASTSMTAKENGTSDNLQEDFTSMTAKEKGTSHNLQEDFTSMTANEKEASKNLQGDFTSMTANEKEASHNLQEDFTSTTAKEKEASHNLQEDLTSMTANEKGTSNNLQEDLTSMTANEKGTSNNLQEDFTLMTANEKGTSNNLQEDFKSMTANEKGTSNNLQEDFTSITAEEKGTSHNLQEDFTSMTAKEKGTSNNLQGDFTSMTANEKGTSNNLQEDFTSITAEEKGTSNYSQEDFTSMTAKESGTSKNLPSEDIKADQVVESSDDTNTTAETSFITKASRILNNSQVEDIDVSSSIDELEITDESTCTADGNVIVVAIDFGTTYSGWAFSLRKRFQDNKLDIQANSGWKSGDGLVTPKVPTCILFDKNEMFHSFGYEAESTYAELLEDNKSEDWRYFSKFKMSLFCEDHSARISRRLKIKDANGDRMSAMKVFAESIRFLKNNFLETLEMRISSIPSHYISWVLTVPAIWTDKAKQFMRLAALEAGIPGSQLTLAYEPEAAALYCRESTYQRKGQLIGPISTFGTGESLLILDCGGGTVDVTAYEILQNGRLKELHEPTGGPWGGTMVDQAFMKFIKNMFGTTVWKKFEHEFGSEVLDIQRHFEQKKKTIGEKSERSEILFMIPRGLFETYEEVHSKTFKTDIGVRRQRDKLRIPTEKIESLFEESLNAIINHVHELLQKPCLVKMKTILLIGGYSDSAILRNKVKEEFLEMTVICPDDAVLSVVKGAVIFGNTPELIQQRVSPLTYGIACNVPFQADKHTSTLLVYTDMQAMCSCVFQVLVRKGDTIKIGQHDFETIFHPTRASDKEATVGIYTSTEHDPLYTFGPYVQELGILKLDIPDARLGKLREIKVCLIFKSTELTAIAKEGGNLVSGSFNCLG